jgi:inosine-uridine nucleoside N-ribohydrolase
VDEHAVDFLARHAAGATLVAVGPLTNVALMLARHPEAKPDRIVLMGGSIGVGNVTPAAEFNIWADPEAAARVFSSGLDLTMIGLDVTHEALMTQADAGRLRAAGRTGTLVAELWEFYNRFHSQTYGFDGSPIHDAVALAHVFRPDLVETERLHVAVDCASELCRGRTVVDLWHRTEEEPNAHVGVGVDGRAFVEFLLERLGSLD